MRLNISRIGLLVFGFTLVSGACPLEAQTLGGDALGERLGAALQRIEGDPSKAATELADLAPEAQAVADYVTYLQALALQQSGSKEQAREGYQRVLSAWPTSPIAPRAAAKLAPLLLARGDRDEVVRLAERYVANGSDATDAAALALAAGEALADSERTRAADWLQRARRLAPGSAVGGEATSVLSDLRRQVPALRPTSPAALLEEAKLATRESDQTLQSEMLERLLAGDPDDPQAVEGALLRAKLIAAGEGKIEAAQWLEQRASRLHTNSAATKLRYAAAVYRWNVDDTDKASELFERVIARAPGSPEAQQAHYSLGRIAEAAGRYAAAAAEYGAATSGPVTEVARESRWRAGWSAYLASQYSLAAQRFEDTAGNPASDDAAREQALYWQGRSLERAGDQEAAESVYRRVVAEFPDGFYALLAEQRAGLAASAPEVVAIDPPDPSEHPVLFVGLERARILDAAGLHEFAARELRALGNPSDTSTARALLPELLAVDAPDQALRTALALYRTGALREPELYPYLYPHAFAPLVDEQARARGLDPFLVYSLIRQESLFDRHAVSPAAAYGLMQLLVPTARRMAAGEPDLSQLSPADLFQPEINIRLGTAYLAELGSRFANDAVLMLAGYNAGEQAAERWRAKLAGFERDEFIEQISYRETRDYVKKVLRNYRNYRRLYGGAGTAAAQCLEEPAG